MPQSVDWPSVKVPPHAIIDPGEVAPGKFTGVVWKTTVRGGYVVLVVLVINVEVRESVQALVVAVVTVVDVEVEVRIVVVE